MTIMPTYLSCEHTVSYFEVGDANEFDDKENNKSNGK